MRSFHTLIDADYIISSVLRVRAKASVTRHVFFNFWKKWFLLLCDLQSKASPILLLYSEDLFSPKESLEHSRQSCEVRSCEVSQVVFL